MLSTPYALTLNGPTAVGARVRRAEPSALRRACMWSDNATAIARTDATFAKKVHRRRPEEEAS